MPPTQGVQGASGKGMLNVGAWLGHPLMGQEAGHTGDTLLPMTAQTAAQHNLSINIVLLLRATFCPFSLTPSPAMSRKGTASTEGGAALGAPRAVAVLSTHPQHRCPCSFPVSWGREEPPLTTCSRCWPLCSLPGCHSSA